MVATAGWPQSPVGPGLGEGWPFLSEEKVGLGGRESRVEGPGATPQPRAVSVHRPGAGDQYRVVGVFPPNQRATRPSGKPFAESATEVPVLSSFHPEPVPRRPETPVALSRFWVSGLCSWVELSFASGDTGLEPVWPGFAAVSYPPLSEVPVEPEPPQRRCRPACQCRAMGSGPKSVLKILYLNSK